MKKICVFCGNKPEKKNKERILPQWLLRMTGDPNRIVKFGYNYPEGKEIIFDWKNFTAPSCTKCNLRYAKLESEIAPIIEKLTSGSEINSNEAIKLLDWFDKVRIGLWLNYYFLEKNKAKIVPRLFIDNRMGKKDRFMQIHFLKSNKKSDGLNAFGVETLSFQLNPSIFGLRINNILIINGSNDFLVSENCGFPFPNKVEFSGMGAISLSDWKYNRSTKTGICGLNLDKGVLAIMQPIHSQIDYNTNFFKDSYLVQNCINGKDRVGTLFRILGTKIFPIQNLSENLIFEEVKGKNVKYIGELISNIYKGQNLFLSRLKPNNYEFFTKAIQMNKKCIKFYNQYHKK